MPIFCTNCGAAIAEGKKFCVTCGTKVDDAPAQSVSPQPTAQPQPPFSQQTQAPASAPTVAVMEPPRQTQPQPVTPSPIYSAAPAHNTSGDAAPPKGSPYATISALGYIGWMILMGLPVIGLIVSILLSFGKGPVNRRNLARAMLVFMGVATIMSIIAFLTIWPALSEYIVIDFGI